MAAIGQTSWSTSKLSHHREEAATGKRTPHRPDNKTPTVRSRSRSRSALQCLGGTDSDAEADAGAHDSDAEQQWRHWYQSVAQAPAMIGPAAHWATPTSLTPIKVATLRPTLVNRIGEPSSGQFKIFEFCRVDRTKLGSTDVGRFIHFV